MTPLQEKITELLVTHLGVDAEGIRPETAYRDLRLDSLALIEFTMIIQRELGVLLDDDALQADSTIADTAELIESKGARV
jgi:acyl carrier protein